MLGPCEEEKMQVEEKGRRKWKKEKRMRENIGGLKAQETKSTSTHEHKLVSCANRL